MNRTYRPADEVAADIKAKGHWRFTVTPKIYKADRLSSLAEAERLVQETKINFRGWDFPHCSWRDEERSRGGNYVQSWIWWERHRDFWRLYQSGQFVYLIGFGEDEESYAETLRRYIEPELEGFAPTGYLNVTNICWTMLEAFSFVSRLSAKGIFDEGVDFEVQMNGIRGRVLSFAEFRRTLSRAYRTEDDQLTYRASLSLEDALSRYREFSNASSRYLLERFGLDISEEIAESMLAELWPMDKAI